MHSSSPLRSLLLVFNKKCLLKNSNKVSLHLSSLYSSKKNLVSTTTTSENDITRRSNGSSSTIKKSWSEEWDRLGLGATPSSSSEQYSMTNLLFVQTGFGVDQHGDRSVDGATKAAVRAVRNAIEFNSIPGVIESVPGGRKEMLIRVKLGVPPASSSSEKTPMDVDLSHVAKVFPYGRILPIDVVIGGLSFTTGRIVPELGDKDDDEAVCVVASVQIGYDDGTRTNEYDDDAIMNNSSKKASHKTYNTNDGY